MNARLLRLSCVVVPLACTGCTTDNIYFYERTKTAISLSFAENPAEPVEAQIGYKRVVVAYVPPLETDGIGDGESQSIISNFRVGYENGNELVIRNGFASGEAAENIGSSPDATRNLLDSVPAIDVRPPGAQNLAALNSACISHLRQTEEGGRSLAAIAASLGMSEGDPAARLLGANAQEDDAAWYQRLQDALLAANGGEPCPIP